MSKLDVDPEVCTLICGVIINIFYFLSISGVTLISSAMMNSVTIVIIVLDICMLFTRNWDTMNPSTRSKWQSMSDVCNLVYWKLY